MIDKGATVAMYSGSIWSVIIGIILAQPFSVLFGAFVALVGLLLKAIQLWFQIKRESRKERREEELHKAKLQSYGKETT